MSSPRSQLAFRVGLISIAPVYLLFVCVGVYGWLSNLFPPQSPDSLHAPFAIDYTIEFPAGAEFMRGRAMCEGFALESQCRGQDHVVMYKEPFTTLSFHIDWSSSRLLRVGVSAPDPYDWFRGARSSPTGLFIWQGHPQELRRGIKAPLVLRSGNHRRNDDEVFGNPAPERGLLVMRLRSLVQ